MHFLLQILNLLVETNSKNFQVIGVKIEVKHQKLNTTNLWKSRRNIFFVNFELQSWLCALKKAKRTLMIFKIVTMSIKVHPRSPEVTKIRRFRQILTMKWPGLKFLPVGENLTQRLYILIVWHCYQLFCKHYHEK